MAFRGTRPDTDARRSIRHGPIGRDECGKDVDLASGNRTGGVLSAPRTRWRGTPGSAPRHGVPESGRPTRAVCHWRDRPRSPGRAWGGDVSDNPGPAGTAPNGGHLRGGTCHCGRVTRKCSDNYDRLGPVHAGDLHGIGHDQSPSEVEPDTFSNGSTIVAAFQVGRIYDGGACAIGFATSTNNGATWTSGLLPGITKCTGGGPYDRATDAAVAYDAQAQRLADLVAALLTEAGGVHGVADLTSRSTDGGLTWGNPVLDREPEATSTRTGSSATTPRPARSTATATREWDDHGAGNRLQMSTLQRRRPDLGARRPPTTPASSAASRSCGPTARSSSRPPTPTRRRSAPSTRPTAARAGAPSPRSRRSATTPSPVASARGRCPSAEIDGAGTVYVVWADCRFRTACKANDIVISHSLNATGTELVGGRARPDRRHEQRHRPLHPGPRREQGHVGRERRSSA